MPPDGDPVSHEAVDAKRPTDDEPHSPPGSGAESWLSTFHSLPFLQTGDNAADGSSRGARDVETDILASVVTDILKLPAFRRHLERQGDAEFEHSFLLASLGQFMAFSLPSQQLRALSQYLFDQIQAILESNFGYSSKHFELRIAGSVAEARLQCMLAAVEKQRARQVHLQRQKQQKSKSDSEKTLTPPTTSSGSVPEQKNPSPQATPSSGNSPVPHKTAPEETVLLRSPVYYLTEGSPAFKDIDSLAWKLLCTKSSFRLISMTRQVPSSSSNDEKTVSSAEATPSSPLASYHMKLSELQAQLIQDFRRGNLPAAVLSVFGGALLQSSPYQCDDLLGLREICNRFGVSLHIEGSSLLLLAAEQSVRPGFASHIFHKADSLVLEPLSWFSLHTPLGLALIRRDPKLLPPKTTSAAPPISRQAFPGLLQLWFQLRSRETEEDPNFLTRIITEQLRLSAHLQSRLMQLSGKIPKHLSSKAFPSTTLQNTWISQRTSSSASASASHIPVLLGPADDYHPHLLFFQAIDLFPPNAEAPRTWAEEPDFLPPAETGEEDTEDRGYRSAVIPASSPLAFPAPPVSPESSIPNSSDQPQQQQQEISTEAASAEESKSKKQQQSGAQSTLAFFNLTVNTLNKWIDSRIAARLGWNAASSTPPQPPSTGRADSAASPQFPPVPSDRIEEPELALIFESAISQTMYQGRLGFLFHPMSSAAHRLRLFPPIGLTTRAWDLFLGAFEEEIRLIQTAGRLRRSFLKLLRLQPEFQSVPHTHVASSTFVGLGAFRVVPTLSTSAQLVDMINSSLVRALNEILGNMFVEGLTTLEAETPGRVCVVVQTGPLLLQYFREQQEKLAAEQRESSVAGDANPTAAEHSRRHSNSAHSRAPSGAPQTPTAPASPSALSSITGWARSYLRATPSASGARTPLSSDDRRSQSSQSFHPSQEDPDSGADIAAALATKQADHRFLQDFIQRLVHLYNHMELPSPVTSHWERATIQGIRQAQERVDAVTYSQYTPSRVAGTFVRKLPLVGSVWSWLSPDEEKAALAELEAESADQTVDPSDPNETSTRTSRAGSLKKDPSSEENPEAFQTPLPQRRVKAKDGLTFDMRSEQLQLLPSTVKTRSASSSSGADPVTPVSSAAASKRSFLSSLEAAEEDPESS